LHVYAYFAFAAYCGSAPRFRERLDKRTGKTYGNFELVVCRPPDPCFTKLRNLFYLKGVKIVPSCLCEFFTAMIWPFLIQDDGSFALRGGVLLQATVEDYD